jgi:hypothetical protein
MPVDKTESQSIVIEGLRKLGDEKTFPDILKTFIVVVHFRCLR